MTDTTASMLMAISLLLMPKYPPLLFKMETSRPYQPLLAWKIASEKLAWTALFLLAGGLALADCVNVSMKGLRLTMIHADVKYEKPVGRCLLLVAHWLWLSARDHSTSNNQQPMSNKQ